MAGERSCGARAKHTGIRCYTFNRIGFRWPPYKLNNGEGRSLYKSALSGHRHISEIVVQEKMSINGLATFTESMPIERVIAELQQRGLPTEAPARRLREDLAQVIFRENGINQGQARMEPGRESITGPSQTVRGAEGHEDPGVAGAMGGNPGPNVPPAESTRLNGDRPSLGAIPKVSQRNQSAVLRGGAAPWQLGMSLPLGQQGYIFDVRQSHALGDGAANYEPENFEIDDFVDPPPDYREVGSPRFVGRPIDRPAFAPVGRANVPFARPLRAERFGPAPEFGRLGYPREVGFPGQDDLEQRHENEAQVQRRISTAFDCLRKLNIKFSGAPGEDPDEFIKSLKEGRQILRVTDEELLQCVPFLLSGVARNWYRTTGAHWRNFQEFENAWFGRFTNPDFQYALREEIRARTQHPRERVTDFLTNLKCLLERVQPPLPERDQIREALRNMLPSISIHLNMVLGIHPWATWADLERWSAGVERSMLNAKQYKPPPSLDESMLPGLAFKDSGRPYRPRPVRVNAVEEEEILDSLILPGAHVIFWRVWANEEDVRAPEMAERRIISGPSIFSLS